MLFAVGAPKPKQSAQKAMPKTPPGQPDSPPMPVRVDKPRDAGPPREVMQRGAVRESTRTAPPRDVHRELGVAHRSGSHRMPEAVRQGSLRGLPPDIPPHDVRREPVPPVQRERDRVPHVSAASHGSSMQRRASAGRHGAVGGSGGDPGHMSGPHITDSARVKSSSSSRSALPPPPKPMDNLPRGVDARSIPEGRSSMKANVKVCAIVHISG